MEIVQILAICAAAFGILCFLATIVIVIRAADK